MKRTRRLVTKPRAKGNRGELAVRDLIREHGWPYTRRNFQSGGQGGGDLTEGPTDVHWEVKWCERCDLRAWLRQCEGDARPTDIPVVAMRDNHHPWTAVLPSDEWRALGKLTERVTAPAIVVGSSRIRFWEHVDLTYQRVVDERARVPVFEFIWPDSDWYSAVPLRTLLELLAAREQA